MKQDRLSTLAVSFILLTMTYGLAARSVHAETPLKFRLLDGHLVVVPVRLDGQGPFDFILDTGANSTLIASELAERLKLSPVDRISLDTITGSAVLPRAIISEAALDCKSTRNLEVLLSDLHVIRTHDPRIQGLLGQNFLSRFNFLLDYQNRSLQFDPWIELNRQAGCRLPLDVVDGQMVVEARSGRATLRLALDSGISEIVLFTSRPAVSLLRNNEAVKGAVSLVKGSSLAGASLLRASRLSRLEIGSHCLRDLLVVLATDGTSVERVEDGVLPTSAFRSLYFNHTENYVILNPEREKLSRR